MFCVIWYLFCNLKNVKNTHGWVILLVKLQTSACNFTKSNIPPWVFFTFLQLYKMVPNRIKHQIYLNLFSVRYVTIGVQLVIRWDRPPFSKICHLWQKLLRKSLRHNATRENSRKSHELLYSLANSFHAALGKWILQQTWCSKLYSTKQWPFCHYFNPPFKMSFYSHVFPVGSSKI